jgi:hypothetical protein
MTELTVMCATLGEPHAGRFLQGFAALADRLNAEFLMAADGREAFDRVLHIEGRKILVRSGGCQEAVLDHMVEKCSGRYVLTLDDDEVVTPAMVAWLEAGEYKAEKHWGIPWANMWTASHFIHTREFWPKFPTRLSVKELAGGRPPVPHTRSPFGRGVQAPVILEHHKFLAKDYATRLERAKLYDRLRPGAGTGPHFIKYQLPERVFKTLTLAPIGDGTFRQWAPEELVTVTL